MSQVSRGPIQNFTKEFRFWRHDRISVLDFEKRADTLDFILFKGSTWNSKVQRSFTGSEYDHISMILRYNNGEIYLLDANSTFGVCLIKWKMFRIKECNKLYDKLVYRQLSFERDDEVIKQLQVQVDVIF